MVVTRRLVLSCTLALAVAARLSAAQESDAFAPCRERFAEKPDDYDSAYCFYQVTLDGRPWQEAARVFDALIAEHPGNFWLSLAYGHVHSARNPDRAERLYRHAAVGFESLGNAEGELLARSNLRHLLFPLGRTDEAAREVERIIEIGEASDDRMLKARAWSLHALHVQASGGDLGHTFRLLKMAEGAIFPHGPYRLKRTNLTSQGIVAADLGRFAESLTIFRRLDELAGKEGDSRTQAVARYNTFDTASMQEASLPTAGGRDRLATLARMALEAGTRAGHEVVMIRSHTALAELLVHLPESSAAAQTHLTECLALARKAQRPHDEARCLWIEATHVRSADPRRSRAAARQAFDATARTNNPRTDADSAVRWMRLSWSTKPREEAIRDALAALNAVETLRALQDAGDSSAAVFSAWTRDYYWLSGRLLQDGRDEYLPEAFLVTERMRARSLLDSLDRFRPRLDPLHPAVRDHRSALEAIAAVQRTLMNPALDGIRRQAQRHELDVLERLEREARRRLALAFPDKGRTPPTFATLDAVQSALAKDEALLSFQVGVREAVDGDFGGDSWLIAVTRSQRTVHRLPDRVQLADVVPMFAGLVEGGDGREAPAAVRLYRELLADALASLPSGVTRLVIVADGVLHRLPFEALRSRLDGPPLGVRYQSTFVPSATLFLQWRANAARASRGKILALADPALGGSVQTEATTRHTALLEGLRLGRLPHAREESRAIKRHAASAETLIGASASEKALKSRDRRDYDILHLAAHAVADEMHPERSAILLSPGDTKEDGLLQAREIEGLDLTGRIVVLSACYTASGAVLSGEGVLSLARSFFQAGAHAVIGSRWPLRDADAANLFDMFYRHLSSGASLSEALKATQDDARAAGQPASAWAALVLLGNGDLRPLAGARPARSPLPAMITMGLTLAIALGVLYSRRRR
jgi:tetratricopeptide (TPR) repeat protein